MGCGQAGAFFYRFALIVCFVTVPLGAATSVDRRAGERTVRVLYLVSSDRHVRQDFLGAVSAAIRDVQSWYRRQLDGRTFRLREPPVEVVRSDKPAAWFTSNPNGARIDDWGFNNALAETK